MFDFILWAAAAAITKGTTMKEEMRTGPDQVPHRGSEPVLYRDSNYRGFTELSVTANVPFSIWDISLMCFSYSK